MNDGRKKMKSIKRQKKKEKITSRIKKKETTWTA